MLACKITHVYEMAKKYFLRNDWRQIPADYERVKWVFGLEQL
ncbi:MAG: hypothetical protein ACOX85_02425 [Candidatus Pararuminococcus gallinarum]